MCDFSAFANRTIKVTYDGETRRGNLVIAPNASPAEAFSAIAGAVAALFEISPSAMTGYCITYPDEDGDLCTLTQNTITDLAQLAPEGIVRLSLTPSSTCGNGRNIEVNACSSPMPMDANAVGESPVDATMPDKDDALRAKLQSVVQKIPAGMRPFILAMAQGMDPAASHDLLGHILGHVEQNAQPNHQSQEASEVLKSLRAMEPSVVHALVLEVLSSNADTDRQTGAEGSASSGPEASNPMEAMLGAFLGGKGCGKGGYAGGPPSPNPLDMLGPLLAGKGFGKGDVAAEAQMQHPLAGLLAGLGKGSGKGFGCPQGAANPGQSPNPMEALFGLLAAGKGAGKGFGTETAGTAPSATPGVATPNDADRAAFEESVNDLLNMGLVTDRQTARELLTQHGDISSVVALLADCEV